MLHRIDDMWSLSAARFVRLAERLPHYPGAVQDQMIAYRSPDVEPASVDDGLADVSDVVEL